MTRRFGKNDIIFIGLLLLFCIASCIVVYKGAAVKGSYLTITVDGQSYGTYSLLEEQTITIAEGENIIVIEDGRAYMSYASCPDQLCVKQHKISFDKESIICLPNKVVLTISSDRESDLDMIIR